MSEALEKLREELDYYEEKLKGYKLLLAEHQITKKRLEEEAKDLFSEGGTKITKNEQKRIDHKDEEIDEMNNQIIDMMNKISKIKLVIEKASNKQAEQKIAKAKEAVEQKKSIRANIRRKGKSVEKGDFTVIRLEVDISHLNGHISLKNYLKVGSLVYNYRTTPSGNSYQLKGNIAVLFDRSAYVDCYFSKILNPTLYPGDTVELVKTEGFSEGAYQKEIAALEEKEKKYKAEKDKKESEKISTEQDKELKDRR